jgi:predicted RNA binding protein YcfA (HicA-like mRNA interferase family)
VLGRCADRYTEPPKVGLETCIVTVREVIRLLEQDGWRLDRQRGSHRQYRHPTMSGTVTVSGNLGSELRAGTLSSVVRQAGLKGPQT